MSEQPRPELADVRRYGRRLMTRFVDQAREADRPQFGTMLTEHLGLPADRLPVAEQQWPAYEHVNVQAALDAWLSEADRSHRLIGLSDYRHRGPFGLADLLGRDRAMRHGGPWLFAHADDPRHATGRTGMDSRPAGRRLRVLRRS